MNEMSGFDLIRLLCIAGIVSMSLVIAISPRLYNMLVAFFLQLMFASWVLASDGNEALGFVAFMAGIGISTLVFAFARNFGSLMKVDIDPDEKKSRKIVRMISALAVAGLFTVPVGALLYAKAAPFVAATDGDSPHTGALLLGKYGILFDLAGAALLMISVGTMHLLRGREDGAA